MTSAPKTQAVTFDVGGTLIQPWPSVGGVYAEVASQHGVNNLSPEKLNKQFATAWRAKKNFQHTHEDWAELVDQTFAGLCASRPSETFFPAIYQRFAELGAWRMYDDVLPALDALASKDIPLAVISNWDARLRPLLEQFRLDRYFEIIVISSEIGFAKPSPVIFEHAAKKLGIAPENIVHVGDSAREDVAGAKAAGAGALLIDRDKKAIQAGQISSLRQLEGLLFPQ
jgi:putative hydrolase of the HAD superfamily